MRKTQKFHVYVVPYGLQNTIVMTNTSVIIIVFTNEEIEVQRNQVTGPESLMQSPASQTSDSSILTLPCLGEGNMVQGNGRGGSV